jgi:acyl-lipid (8-3)-desaturase
VCHIAGLTLDAVGASSFMWKQQHVVGHHVFTNVSSEDPDIRVATGGTDVRRITQWQPRGVHHAVQHLYLGALYGLLALKSIFVDDFSALASGSIGAVRLSKLRGHEAAAFWAGKILFAAWWLVAPAAAGVWKLPQLAALWLVCLLCCGWTLAFMFQVCALLVCALQVCVGACVCAPEESSRGESRSLGRIAWALFAASPAQTSWAGSHSMLVQVAHVVEEVEFLEKDGAGQIAGSWAAKQVATSADFAHGSAFWTHISGGLNYQIVHHLFPGVIHTHYPALAPIVQRVAAKHGVKYTVFPSLWSALHSHFKHLQRVGAYSAPSLHTIG